MANETNLTDALHQWSKVFVRRSMHDFMQYTRQYNLAMPHLSIILHLYHRGPASILTIRQTMAGSRSAMTQLVDKLVKMGLVQRTEDSHDRRIKDICLTESGIKVAEETVAAKKMWMKDLAESFPPKEQEQLISSLQALTERALEQESSNLYSEEPPLSHQ